MRREVFLMSTSTTTGRRSRMPNPLPQLLGSTYFTVRETAGLRGLGEPEERITAVATWRDATCFTEAERVTLELVEAALIAKPIPGMPPGRNSSE
ncbi:hypothetical protein AB0J71_46130 [Nonomuraea sp. NPDC049637]|uniref:hypothetical protein n=1 Tax=Nonomuraea sp. NPDC049637 TaxID=3154356 RepID=UPI003441EB17